MSTEKILRGLALTSAVSGIAYMVSQYEYGYNPFEDPVVITAGGLSILLAGISQIAGSTRTTSPPVKTAKKRTPARAIYTPELPIIKDESLLNIDGYPGYGTLNAIIKAPNRTILEDMKTYTRDYLTRNPGRRGHPLYQKIGSPFIPHPPRYPVLKIDEDSLLINTTEGIMEANFKGRKKGKLEIEAEGRRYFVEDFSKFIHGRAK